MPVGSLVKGIVTKITAFGAFVELDNGIEALVHVTELSDQPFGKVEEVVKVGDPITAKVIKLDPEHKKIALSIKDYLVEQNQYSHDEIVVGAAKGKAKTAAKRKSKSESSRKREEEQEEMDE
ncbi:MAG TPA: S1 RNA-binding domain-containing protein [Rhabdochlamydiaceae bacterium]|nr:S1 RNA-binding domain-containing protein [Rhabdochlamydiaceae bacterium]